MRQWVVVEDVFVMAAAAAVVVDLGCFPRGGGGDGISMDPFTANGHRC